MVELAYESESELGVSYSGSVSRLKRSSFERKAVLLTASSKTSLFCSLGLRRRNFGVDDVAGRSIFAVAEVPFRFERQPQESLEGD